MKTEKGLRRFHSQGPAKILIEFGLFLLAIPNEEGTEGFYPEKRSPFLHKEEPVEIFLEISHRFQFSEALRSTPFNILPLHYLIRIHVSLCVQPL